MAVQLTPQKMFDSQSALTLFNRKRLSPVYAPDLDQDAHAEISRLKLELSEEMIYRERELMMLERDRAEIRDLAAEAPLEVEAFIAWYENLKETGPGQNDPLFKWLAEEASIEEMRWFLSQEVAGEAGFDDLVALTQLRMPTSAKLELARNYWDEMGRGNEKGMHGPMLTKLAEELGLEELHEPIVPEALALGNLLVGLAANRNYAYQSVGALGIVELTAPGRAACVYQGLKRLGVSPVGQRYYLLHSTLDVQHSITWNREVLRPLVTADPKCARALAEGALMRLQAGARCFEKYRSILWNRV